MYPRVSIHIVAWNSMDFLPELLPSIFAQTFKDFQVLIVDNASSDGMDAYVRANFPQVTILRNPRNIGFSPAHNQGIRYALERWNGEDLNNRFILVTNPDAVLSPTYLEEVLREADRQPEVGSFGGKLLRAYRENVSDDALKETVKSDRIDSTGLAAHRNRTFTERGAGEMDKGQYDQDCDVFGVTGALALYRASALQDVRYKDEFFDHDFFAYKEDVDLAWRLQLLGWKSLYVPAAVAYHHRGMYGKEKMGLWELIKNRRSKSRSRSFYSTRNHVDMLFKNELVWNAILAAPFIFITEWARFTYVVLCETANAKAFVEAAIRLPRMWAKRRDTLKRRKASAGYMRRFFR